MSPKGDQPWAEKYEYMYIYIKYAQNNASRQRPPRHHQST